MCDSGVNQANSSPTQQPGTLACPAKQQAQHGCSDNGAPAPFAHTHATQVTLMSSPKCILRCLVICHSQGHSTTPWGHGVVHTLPACLSTYQASPSCSQSCDRTTAATLAAAGLARSQPSCPASTTILSPRSSAVGRTGSTQLCQNGRAALHEADLSSPQRRPQRRLTTRPSSVPFVVEPGLLMVLRLSHAASRPARCRKAERPHSVESTEVPIKQASLQRMPSVVDRLFECLRACQ